MTLAEFLDHFPGARRSGKEYKARCPVHDDRTPSLSIGEGRDGVVIKCFAGCKTEDILAAVNLTFADLYEKPRQARSTEGQILRTFAYRYGTGPFDFYEKVRCEPKVFYFRRPDGRGGWIHKLAEDTPRVLFRVADIQGKRYVVLTEGERDVNTCWDAGIPATCNDDGGARPDQEPKWKDVHTQQLVAAGIERVCLLPDNDAVGRAHAEAMAKSCTAAGLRVRLATLPDGKDVTEFLERHSVEELKALLKSAPRWTPTAPSADAGPNADDPPRLAFTTIGDLLREPEETIEWIVVDRIARGSVNELAGKPKTGKTTLARNLVYQVAIGGNWLGSACVQGPVWYINFEDRRSKVRQHFRELGATDADPIRILVDPPRRDFIGDLHRLAAIEKPILIVVDTLQRLLHARDLNDYAEVTERLTPLIALANDTGAAVLFVHHAGKGERAGIDASLGSTAITGSMETILLLTRNEQQQRILSSIQRTGPDLPESLVTMDPLTGRVTLGGTRYTADVAQMKNQIMMALKDAPVPLTEDELGKLVVGKTELKRTALRDLVQSRVVERIGEGRRGRPFRFLVSSSPHRSRDENPTNQKPPVDPIKTASDSRSRDPGFSGGSGGPLGRETGAPERPSDSPEADVFEVH